MCLLWYGWCRPYDCCYLIGFDDLIVHDCNFENARSLMNCVVVANRMEIVVDFANLASEAVAGCSMDVVAAQNVP